MTLIVECPTCKGHLNRHTFVAGQGTPAPGDVTICCRCNEVLQFTDTLTLELASVEAIEEIGLLDLSRAQNLARQQQEQNKIRNKQILDALLSGKPCDLLKNTEGDI